jgi:hypothetical protein
VMDETVDPARHMRRALVLRGLAVCRQPMPVIDRSQWLLPVN